MAGVGIYESTYRSAFEFATPSGADDIGLEIVGAATKVIEIRYIRLQTTTGTNLVLKRMGTPASGGTSTPGDKTPLDIGFPAAVATIKRYTAQPTPGALIGFLEQISIEVNRDTIEFRFGGGVASPLRLTGAIQAVTICKGTASSVAFRGVVEWTES